MLARMDREIARILDLVILRAAGQIRLPVRIEPFDPREFFRTREGLLVSDSFWDLILLVAKLTSSIPETILTLFDLVRVASDAEICAELPERHIFEASTFCSYLAGIIFPQLNGKPGNLLTNGYTNIFYVRGANGEVFVVYVRWYSDYREWRVRACRLVNRWNDGNRVFSNC